jgi:hypothetical protein
LNCRGDVNRSEFFSSEKQILEKKAKPSRIVERG